MSTEDMSESIGRISKDREEESSKVGRSIGIYLLPSSIYFLTRTIIEPALLR